MTEEEQGRKIIVFEQNGFSQEGAEITLREKNNMLGFLRKRG